MRAFVWKLTAVLAFLAYFPCPAFAAPISVEVMADGARLQSSGSSLPEISPSAQKIVFRMGDPGQDAALKFQRVRYKLVGPGTDGEWKQKDGSNTFTVCFYDQPGSRFGQKIYEVKGQSSGWNEDISKAVFTHRRETLTVPDNARGLGLVVSSAGSAPSVGVYVFKGVLVTRAAANEADGLPGVVLDGRTAASSEKEKKSDKPLWITDGTRRPMAQILQGPPDNVLSIVDTDVGGHAEWRLAGDLPRVVPGERLNVEWDEVYESGVGESISVMYGSLPPGRYDFVVQKVDVWGKPVGSESSIAFIVPAPYWKNPWFWACIVISANVLLILGVHHFVRLKARRQLERRRLVEEERLRIAQDLHDDLGARLTHLSLLSAQAGSGASAAADKESFREISHVTRDIVAALSQTVWTVNPSNDHLESLVGFLCRMITTQCKAYGVRCRIDALALTDRRPVASDLRHHVVLAIKEAVNNAFKHSGTAELHARIAFQTQSSTLLVVIADQGSGFDTDTDTNTEGENGGGATHKGNGLQNMQQRMAAINGTVTLKSSTTGEGKGTTVTFEIPIPPSPATSSP